MTIKGYIHVSTIGNWNQLLLYQIYLIKKTGLYDIVDFIEIGKVGKESFDLKDDKIQCLNLSEDLDSFEFPTLKRLYEKAIDGTSFYIHLKGVSKTLEHWEKHKEIYASFAGIYELDTLVYHEKLWRKYMEYFIIERHKDCLEMLKYNDLVGVHWRDKPFPHFSGNFWWANDLYLQCLKHPNDFLESNKDYRDIMGSNRAIAEFWVGGGNPKVETLFNNSMHLYNQAMLPQIYRKNKIF